MHIITEAEVAGLLDAPSLVETLREAFRTGCVAPQRHLHTVGVPGGPDATLLLMPAWSEGGYLGVKVAAVFPGNVAANKPAVAATYLLSDATDGRILAAIDGGELTARRTAATSVLAASYLAVPRAKNLLIVGTGRIARHLAHTYKACRPELQSVAIWGRTPSHAAALVAALSGEGIDAAPASDLEAAVKEADIVASATLAREPLIKGRWLKAGQHLDLIGSYTPEMREADDAAVASARVVVDTLDALHESGDIVQPLKSGALQRDRITDLATLVREVTPARDANEITLFKSVGCALEDLAAATLAHRRRG